MYIFATHPPRLSLSTSSSKAPILLDFTRPLHISRTQEDTSPLMPSSNPSFTDPSNRPDIDDSTQSTGRFNLCTTSK